MLSLKFNLWNLMSFLTKFQKAKFNFIVIIGWINYLIDSCISRRGTSMYYVYAFSSEYIFNLSKTISRKCSLDYQIHTCMYLCCSKIIIVVHINIYCLNFWHLVVYGF